MDNTNNNPPRATLADRESREFGVEPLDAAAPVQYAALGVDQRRKLIADALIKRATVPRRCKACGGGSVYLATRPGLEFCTPECAERGPSKVRVISSAMDIDLSGGVPMGNGEPVKTLSACQTLSARETMASVDRALAGYAQLRGEDAFASAMFDGDAPPTEEPSIGIGELIEQRDEAIAALDRAVDELRAARAENEALRKQIREVK